MDTIRTFVYSHFRHVLFGLLLLSRIGDVVSTWLTSPQLKLEANPIVRRLGWPLAVASIGVSGIAYYDTTVAVMILVPFLLVSAANFSRTWMVRTMGEDAYVEMLLGLARRGSLAQAVTLLLVSASFVALAGIVLIVLSAPNQWGYPFGVGLVAYALIQAFYGTLALRRRFLIARARAIADPVP